MHRVVPELIVENFRNNEMSGKFPAVGMFLDLSGFSNMTDSLMQRGQHGAEVLAGLMHSVFDPLVQNIFNHGGKIVSFAGDGIMALYPIEDDDRSTALRALASAWFVQQQLLNNPERVTVYGKFPLSVKIGLAVGSVSWKILQSDDDRQALYYFRGSAVDDSAAAEHKAGARNVVITPSMRELLNDDIRAEPHGDLHRFVGFLSEIPEARTYSLAPIDVDISRRFMPEDVIVHDIRGEFRQIVNLFMRIPDLPDDELEGFVSAVFELRKQYGGLLTRLDFGDKGCNMLILWGAPTAYENDIGRALNFMLDLQERVNFPITAGVTYYVAHAGYLGSEMCEDYTCYGWGVNLASRFMMNAPIGTIWVDDRVARRVSQRFEVEYLGSQPFKGFAEEQKVYLLRGRKRDLDPIYQGEMVGREEELEKLERFVAPLWHGKFAGALSITGDAGIGKGRLIHAFNSSDLFKEHDALWAMCQADQILRGSFNPLRKWLFRYFGISPNQTADERRRAFDSKLDGLLASLSESSSSLELGSELASELNRIRSILAALVDVTWVDSLYSQLDAEARYNNAFLALIALVKAESLRQPVILFVDDVHFIDSDSKTFLSRLKRSLSIGPEAYPVAILLLYRKQGAASFVQDDLFDSEIELRGISQAEISRLAETLLGDTVSPQLVELVISRSEGNPYFAEQVIRYLQEEGLLEMSSEGWRQVDRARASLLPGDIRALLVARLDQLKQEVKNIVQTASVLGREFEIRVLLQMLVEETDITFYVTEAEKAAIWAPLQELRYIFHHGLLRDAAYTMQMRARRKELHILALHALESLYGEDPGIHSAELAYHAEHGELASKAQRYYAQAGSISAASFQNEQAVEYFTRAFAYTPFDQIEMQYDLVAERVEILSRMGKRDLQLKDLNSLEQWAQKLEDGDRIAKSLMLRATYSYFTGAYKDAIEQADNAEQFAEALVDSELALYTQVVRFMSLLHLGRVNESMEMAQRALEKSQRLENRKEMCRVLTAMGLVALEDKEPAHAVKYLSEAVDIAREIKDLSLEARALNNLAIAEGSVNGNYARARKYYEESYKLTRVIGDRHAECTVLSSLGFVAGMEGDLSDARSYHEQSLKFSRELGSPYLEMYTHVNLSALAGITNDVQAALQHAQLAADLAQKTSQRSLEAWAMLYMGHAHLLQNELDIARTVYRKSASIRNELNQPALSMEPLAGLVEAYLREEDVDSALVEAEKILDYLQNGGTLDGAEEPLRVYHACYVLLEKKQDKRATQILKTAGELLESQIEKFSDAETRRRFVENIPWRRAIRDLTRS